MPRKYKRSKPTQTPLYNDYLRLCKIHKSEPYPPMKNHPALLRQAIAYMNTDWIDKDFNYTVPGVRGMYGFYMGYQDEHSFDTKMVDTLIHIYHDGRNPIPNPFFDPAYEILEKESDFE